MSLAQAGLCKRASLELRGPHHASWLGLLSLDPIKRNLGFNPIRIDYLSAPCPTLEHCRCFHVFTV